MNRIVVTAEDLIGAAPQTEDDFSVAISQQEYAPELPPDLAELIFLTVHNFKVEMNRICDDNPDCDPQDIWDCANHFMIGGM